MKTALLATKAKKQIDDSHESNEFNNNESQSCESNIEWRRKIALNLKGTRFVYRSMALCTLKSTMILAGRYSHINADGDSNHTTKLNQIIHISTQKIGLEELSTESNSCRAFHYTTKQGMQIVCINILIFLNLKTCSDNHNILMIWADWQSQHSDDMSRYKKCSAHNNCIMLWMK